MEGSNSEAVFESLNLSPRLFINEVRNAVDDLLDEAFDFFLNEAPKLLQTEGTERSAELIKGVEYVRDLVCLSVEQRMQKWEEYCLHFCFRVPEEFSLPTANESHNDELPALSAVTDKELDEELTLLREKLAEVGRETAELTKELHAMEGQSLPNDQSDGSINEALLLYKERDADKIFQELTALASTFREKVGNLKRKGMEEIQCDEAERMKFSVDYLLRTKCDNGIPLGSKLEELERWASKMNSW